MYLIIHDPLLIRDPNRYYKFCSGEYYNRTIQSVPDISILDNNSIDEILIYSGVKSDEENLVKTATCSAIEHGEGFFKLEYGNLKTTDIVCKDVKGRVYRYCMQNNLLIENKFSPDIIIVDNIQSYIDIKSGRLTSRYKSIMAQLEEYQKKNDWLSIVKLFPDEKNIKKSEYWNDVMCLSRLSFALSMLAVKSHQPKARKYDGNTRHNYDSFFLLTSDRCLELQPEVSMHKSSRAYYYYDLYINGARDDYYIKAFELYESLITSSTESYKESYRFAKLRQTHFEKNQWNGSYIDTWLSTSNAILDSYQALIESYESLDELRKKQYHKYYLKSLFGYSTFSIDSFLAYWDDYVKFMLWEQKTKSYKLQSTYLNRIISVENYLNILFSEKNFDDLSKINIQDKPGYFDVQYRLAQIEQIKGLVYVMKEKKPSEYTHFFEKSNGRIDAIFSLAKERKEKNEKFNFPHYAKLPKAINLYFLENYEECHRCFYHARPYMLYEEACIYALCKDYTNAANILTQIPESDTCYNKAQKLIERIQELKAQNEN